MLNALILLKVTKSAADIPAIERKADINIHTANKIPTTQTLSLPLIRHTQHDDFGLRAGFCAALF